MRCSDREGGPCGRDRVVGGALLVGGCQTDREVTRPDPVPVTRSCSPRRSSPRTTCRPPTCSTRTPTPLGPEIVPEHECDDRLNELEPEETATVTFTGTGLGTTLTNTISYFPGKGGAVVDVLQRPPRGLRPGGGGGRGPVVHD